MTRRISKLLALAVVTCLLVLTAYRSSSVGATPPPHRVATYIDLFKGQAGPYCLPIGAWFTVGSNCPPAPGEEVAGASTIDPAQFSFFTRFRFETTVLVATSSTMCWRLFDLTAGQAVSGTVRCESNPDPNLARFVRIASPPVHLARGPHDYVAQVQGTGQSDGFLFRARVLTAG